MKKKPFNRDNPFASIYSSDKGALDSEGTREPSRESRDDGVKKRAQCLRISVRSWGANIGMQLRRTGERARGHADQVPGIPGRREWD